MANNRQIIEEALRQADIEFSDSLPEQLELYYNRLVEWNEKMNLTAITAIEDVSQKHFADSLLLLKTGWLNKGATCIDIGTGAGFPGLVLKLARPDLEMTLLDSVNKRILFLQRLCEDLGLRDIDFVHSRIEDAGNASSLRAGFDFCLSRAVANVAVLVEYSLPLVKLGGAAIAYKGPAAKEEFASASEALLQLGASAKLVCYEGKTAWGERVLLRINKERPSPKRFPRQAGEAKRKPL